MFVACGIWCLADVSSISPSSEQTDNFFVLLGLRATPFFVFCRTTVHLTMQQTCITPALVTSTEGSARLGISAPRSHLILMPTPVLTGLIAISGDLPVLQNASTAHQERCAMVWP